MNFVVLSAVGAAISKKLFTFFPESQPPCRAKGISCGRAIIRISGKALIKRLILSECRRNSIGIDLLFYL
jgi:hypothetical protein